MQWCRWYLILICKNTGYSKKHSDIKTNGTGVVFSNINPLLFNLLNLFFHFAKTQEKQKEIVVLQKLNLAC
jgi:hypothetical protein